MRVRVFRLSTSTKHPLTASTLTSSAVMPAASESADACGPQRIHQTDAVQLILQLVRLLLTLRSMTLYDRFSY